MAFNSATMPLPVPVHNTFVPFTSPRVADEATPTARHRPLTIVRTRGRRQRPARRHGSLSLVPVRVLFGFGGGFLAVGLIWLGQGVGLVGGSFMTGEAVWAVIGGVCMVLGAFLVRAGFRWRRAASVDDDG